MPRKVKNSVPIEQAKQAALLFLDSKPEGYLAHASEIAYAVWPGVKFRAQGAGGAGSRILVRLKAEGFVCWGFEHRFDGTSDVGWAITPKGRGLVNS